MCGIGGIYNIKTKEPVKAPVVEKMIDSLNHRDPDDTGYYVENEVRLGQCLIQTDNLASSV